MPLVLPAIVAGALVAFLQAMNNFGSPAILALPAGLYTVTTKIWSLFQYPPQPGLAAPERRRNLRDAFAVASPATVQSRHIVLVDDVLTTGATADACARALVAAGAKRIDVYTVGRAP